MAALAVPVSVPMLALRRELIPLFEHFIVAAEQASEDPEGNMGDLEDGIARDLTEMQRLALERVSQRKADAADHDRCPQCGEKLSRTSHGHARQVRTRFGQITLTRAKGYCAKCEQWRFPADDLLGLDKHATASPAVQRAESFLVSKMPAEEAARAMEELTGRPADDSTMAREARRQGERARDLRRKMDEEACHTEGRWAVTERLRKELGPAAKKPFVLVIQMDAWMVRERDHWGETEQRRGNGEDFSRWHWVYTATIYRLDQRATTQSGRPMILSRGYVATREGVESFSQQVYAEAVRQGLLLAEDSLVIADGGVWIWKIADDRFPHSRQRLDNFHAAQHLHAVAAELHGRGTAEAKKFVRPLLHQLRHGGEAGVVSTLADLAAAAAPEHEDMVRREAAYFERHKDHLDYAAGAAAGEPIGSGAIESTCRQHQCRFKRPGQFWSKDGDEALLALEVCWRNGRWNELFPRQHKKRHAGS